MPGYYAPVRGIATKYAKLLLFTVIGGVVITLLTGLIENTPEMLVGAVWYGYPLPWLIRQVLAPEYFPWVIRPLRLILDVVFWAVIAGIALLTYTKLSKKP